MREGDLVLVVRSNTADSVIRIGKVASYNDFILSLENCLCLETMNGLKHLLDNNEKKDSSIVAHLADELYIPFNSIDEIHKLSQDWLNKLKIHVGNNS